MLSLRWIRDNPDLLDAALVNRGLTGCSQELLALDQQKRDIQVRLEALRHEKKTVAREVGAQMKRGEDASQAQARAKELKDLIPAAEEELRSVHTALQELLERLPNTPDAAVPVGADETANVVIKNVGTPKDFSFHPRAHYELGEALGGMDFETAARMSGSRFVVLTGALARLERALAHFMLEHHTQKFGYQEVSPPYLVRDQAMYGVGLLPKFADDAFATTDGRWLIPTAEVSLTNLVREKILDAAELPLRFVAYTPSFRSESGAAGRDTRGMIRLHQFGKVELVSVVRPEAGVEEHERMTRAAESILESLELPYRRLHLCTGDMGVQSMSTYDLEVWLPSENTYREISSCSLCGTYQAQRMDTRYRPAASDTTAGQGRKTEFVHTLNGSGLAVGRTLVALLENYQNADGSVTIPPALRPFMHGQERISPETTPPSTTGKVG